jgi:hypothetical protein
MLYINPPIDILWIQNHDRFYELTGIYGEVIKSSVTRLVLSEWLFYFTTVNLADVAKQFPNLSEIFITLGPELRFNITDPEFVELQRPPKSGFPHNAENQLKEAYTREKLHRRIHCTIDYHAF